MILAWVTLVLGVVEIGFGVFIFGPEFIDCWRGGRPNTPDTDRDRR